MRILAVNPDTLGDVVLRQPMYHALMDAGHDLTLLLRPLVTPIARLIAPNARTIEFAHNIYDAMLRPGDASLEPLVEQAMEARPDVLLVAAFQWTALEERLAESLTAENPSVRVVALTGHPFESATWGGAYESSLRARATVEADEALPELRKNERLASAVLGRAVTLPEPRIEPDSACLRAAEARLVSLGLKPGAYWVACVGETETTRIRNWPLERWSALLAKWHREHGRRFLLIGEAGETESLRAVEQGVKREAGAGACAVWTGEDRGALDTLIGLIARSRGYVGRDTGPMHLAAAMEKPVLAIFGGGTWPRFVPAARGGGAALTMGVPCIGCGWHCHLDRSVCIKDVPLEAAMDAVRAIEAAKPGDKPGLEARVLEPGPEQLSEIARQSTSVARERLVKLGQSILETKQLRAEHRMELKELKEMKENARLDRGVIETVVRSELSRFDQSMVERAVRAEVALGQVRAELDATKRQLAVSSVRQSELQAQVMQLAGERAQHATAAASARDRVIELDARAGTLEQRLVAKEKELQAAKGQPAPASAVASPDLVAKASQAQALAARLQGEKARAEAELADARLTIQRLRGDLQTLATQTEQSSRQLALANERVHNLMASRWRKLGQRLGVAMVMPWERDSSANGKH